MGKGGGDTYCFHPFLSCQFQPLVVVEKEEKELKNHTKMSHHVSLVVHMEYIYIIIVCKR